MIYISKTNEEQESEKDGVPERGESKFEHHCLQGLHVNF